MNRRSFLAAMAGAFVADPERLLWVPGRKLISIPKPHQLEAASYYWWPDGPIVEAYWIHADRIYGVPRSNGAMYAISFPATTEPDPPSPAPCPQR